MKAAKIEKKKAKAAAKVKAKAAKKEKAKAKAAAKAKAKAAKKAKAVAMKLSKKAKAMKAPMKKAMKTKKVVKKLIEVIPGVGSILFAAIVGALSFGGATLAVFEFRRSASGPTKKPLLVA